MSEPPDVDPELDDFAPESELLETESFFAPDAPESESGLAPLSSPVFAAPFFA